MTLLKGRKLLIRAIKFLCGKSLRGFFKIFFSHMTFFLTQNTLQEEKEWQIVDDEIVEVMCKIFNETNYDITFFISVLEILNQFQKVVHQLIVKNENCSTTLAHFLNKANTAEGSDEDKNKYNELFRKLGEILSRC